jgi:large subunit ribosomal protein L25
MERIIITTEKREECGKGAARSLRRKSMIPAILYRDGSSTPIKFSKKDLTQFFNTSAGTQIMVNLQFADGDSKLALMKDYQLDPVKGELLHADFFEVSLTEKVKVIVHVTTVGEPIGAKRDKGILQHLFREIEVECLPDRIPSNIEVDISGLEIGQSFHVSDIVLEDDIKILTNPEEVLVTIVAPLIEEVVAPVEEAEVPKAVEPEGAEPEVIKKGKKEEEVEGQEEKKTKKEEVKK